jgi:hypothetical protein
MNTWAGIEEWATVQKKRGEGCFHNKRLTMKVPDKIFELLAQEAKKREMKISTFAKVLIEKALKEELSKQ